MVVMCCMQWLYLVCSLVLVMVLFILQLFFVIFGCLCSMLLVMVNLWVRMGVGFFFLVSFSVIFQLVMVILCEMFLVKFIVLVVLQCILSMVSVEFRFRKFMLWWCLFMILLCCCGSGRLLIFIMLLSMWVNIFIILWYLFQLKWVLGLNGLCMKVVRLIELSRYELYGGSGCLLQGLVVWMCLYYQLLFILLILLIRMNLGFVQLYVEIMIMFYR